jgi:hypothetical protein
MSPFATTRWSVVLTAQTDSPAAVQALDKLCSTYWWPLYGFVRRQGYSPEEAQDLTQGFFARLLERRDLEAVRREKGRLRSYLLAALKNFIANEQRRAMRIKRGEGRPLRRWGPPRRAVRLAARRMTFLGLLRKELRAYFVSPLVYVVGAVFYALTGFFFYTQLVYFVQYGFGFNIIGNFWIAFLAGAPYSVSTVLLLIVPLLTMRQLAEEKKLGTIELLLNLGGRQNYRFGARLVPGITRSDSGVGGKNVRAACGGVLCRDAKNLSADGLVVLADILPPRVEI